MAVVKQPNDPRELFKVRREVVDPLNTGAIINKLFNEQKDIVHAVKSHIQAVIDSKLRIAMLGQKTDNEYYDPKYNLGESLDKRGRKIVSPTDNHIEEIIMLLDNLSEKNGLIGGYGIKPVQGVNDFISTINAITGELKLSDPKNDPKTISAYIETIRPILHTLGDAIIADITERIPHSLRVEPSISAAHLMSTKEVPQVNVAGRLRDRRAEIIEQIKAKEEAELEKPEEERNMVPTISLPYRHISTTSISVPVNVSSSHSNSSSSGPVFTSASKPSAVISGEEKQREIDIADIPNLAVLEKEMNDASKQKESKNASETNREQTNT